MKLLRHDVNALVSIALLVTTTIAILTGIIADVWDRTGFVFHTYAGYVMAALVMFHVALNWGRLRRYVYARLFRSGSTARTRSPAFATVHPRRSTVEPSAPGIVRALHPYELPAIHAFAMEHVYAPYGAWVEENSSAT